MANYSKLKKDILSKKDCPKLNNENNVIKIKVNNSSELLSPYTEDNKAVISSDFANFLNNTVKDTSIKQDLTIEIDGCTEKEKISNAIKTYYYNEFIESERKLKRNLIFTLSTFIMGIISIILFHVFDSQNLSFIFTNSIEILAWVFMWEAFDLYFFRRKDIKFEQYRQMNFINAKIILK